MCIVLWLILEAYILCVYFIYYAKMLSTQQQCSADTNANFKFQNEAIIHYIYTYLKNFHS